MALILSEQVAVKIIMSSRYKTGRKNEALEALPEIIDLAKDVLSEDKYLQAEEVAKSILSSKRNREIAIARLKIEIGNKPSRPVFYLWPLLDGLPRYTRDSIRYSGDYLDLLVKELTFEKINGNARKRSLGVNSRALKKIPFLGELSNYLIRYCDFLYNPGKHDFSLPLGRSHRFTSREVVLTVYVTAELGRQILAISENAKEAVKADNWYAVGGGKWGGSERVRYFERER